MIIMVCPGHRVLWVWPGGSRPAFTPWGGFMPGVEVPIITGREMMDGRFGEEGGP
jgi:hypothetical protein